MAWGLRQATHFLRADSEGKVRYSKNMTNPEQLVMLTSYMNYLCNTMWKLKEES